MFAGAVRFDPTSVGCFATSFFHPFLDLLDCGFFFFHGYTTAG